MIRTPSILFWFGLIFAASIALYRTSDRVQDLNHQLHVLDASIDSEQQSIHVLKAEWAYLSSPAHVESAAKKYLSMRPTSPKQITSLAALDSVLSSRDKPVATAAAGTPPIANVKISYAAPAPAPHVLKAAYYKPAPAHVAAAEPDHANNHMRMERTASAQPMPDSIGAMISQLDSHP